MLCLRTHSTHFIVRLFDVRHMIDHNSDNERANPMLPLHELLFFRLAAIVLLDRFNLSLPYLVLKLMFDAVIKTVVSH